MRGADLNNISVNATTISNVPLEKICYNYGLCDLKNPDGGNFTTQRFVDFLRSLGAFNYLNWKIIGYHNYANSSLITDTNCGVISLAGAIIEVLRGDNNNYMIRIQTASQTQNNSHPTNTMFIYKFNSDRYNPHWVRLANINEVISEQLNLNSMNINELQMGGGYNGLHHWRLRCLCPAERRAA